MIQTVRPRLAIATAACALILTACFSSNPTRTQEDSGGSSSGGGSSGSQVPTGAPSTGGGGQSRTDGNPTRDSTATATESGDVETDSQGSTTGQRSAGGRLPGKEGGEDGAADIRVASAERSGAGTDAPEAAESDIGSSSGTLSENPDVGVEEALEGANAAVDAAAEAVSDAEATIARAKETGGEGGGNVESFDPWATPGAGEQSSTDKTAGGGGQPQQSATGESTAAANTGGGSDSAAGNEDLASTRGGGAGEESFDPFADYGKRSARSGRPGDTSGSLQIADDALAAARAALNRARRALIAAAGAGSGDADAEAVQLAAARAAMEAAAEAVIASAIAVMAASDVMGDDSDAGGETSEEALAAGVGRVVAIVQRDMRNAAEALEATSELLAAAGALIGILNQGEQRYAGEGSGSDPGDRMVQLEDELDKSLAVFDDRMQSEGSNVVPGMSGEDSELAGVSEAGGNTDPRAAQRAGRRGSARDDSGRGRDLVNSRPDVEWNAPRNTDDIEPVSDSATPNEEFAIEDAAAAQDDDIIARQLREAAMAETDPELREALWQEYRNYKESLETGEADAN